MASDWVLAQGRYSGMFQLRNARGAYSDEFDLMPEDFEISVVFKTSSNRDIKIDGCINHTITSNTSEVVMFFRIPVKPFQGAPRFKFLNITAFSKDFKVAIYGSKADTGQALANHCIDLIGTGMIVHLTKLLEDNFTLTRHPEI
jgi:hypothetical protein